MKRVSPFLQSGVSMIETVIIFPIVLMIALWVIHIGLVYQARANLEYAALMGARVGASTNIDVDRMKTEIVRRLTPSQVGNKAVSVSDIAVSVLNPTVEMFRNCGVVPLDDTVVCGGVGNCELPNFGLQFLSTVARCDGVSMQDANILRIRVAYKFNSKIPFMNVRLFATDYGNDNVYDDNALGTTVIAIATVRMQSPARMTNSNSGAFVN